VPRSEEQRVTGKMPGKEVAGGQIRSSSVERSTRTASAISTCPSASLAPVPIAALVPNEGIG